MPLIYVTEISGVGKSTLKPILVARGISSFDMDEDDITHWENKETYERVKPVENPPSKEWREQNAWRISRARVEK